MQLGSFFFVSSYVCFPHINALLAQMNKGSGSTRYAIKGGKISRGAARQPFLPRQIKIEQSERCRPGTLKAQPTWNSTGDFLYTGG